MTAPRWNEDRDVPRDVRSAALWMIDKKLTGDERLTARAFVRARQRSRRDVEAFIERLTGRPDLPAPAGAALGDETIKRMRAERAAGATLRELAARYCVSQSTVSRHCPDTSAR